MADRARLVAPPPKPREKWEYHALKFSSVPVSAVFAGDRRMEAETYLSSGFGIRTSIEAKRTGWKAFGDLASVEQPGRLKAILVPPACGNPFFAATQVFDVRPVARKFLAMGKMATAETCFVDQGTILVTRSGSVGRATITNDTHRGVVLSDDLLRVYPRSKRDYGWLYAYLRSPQGRAIATGSHYGHIIKHLEKAHLAAMPVPIIDDVTAGRFNDRVAAMLALRNESYRLTLEAESVFEKALGAIAVTDWGESGFSVKASRLFGERRRLDASVHNPGVSAVRKHLKKNGAGMISVADAGYETWLPGRFRRIPASDGVSLVESSALLEVNPDIDKRIAEVDFGDPY